MQPIPDLLYKKSLLALNVPIMTAADDKFCDMIFRVICLVGQMGRSNTVSTCTARIIFPFSEMKPSLPNSVPTDVIVSMTT